MINSSTTICLLLYQFFIFQIFPILQFTIEYHQAIINAIDDNDDDDADDIPPIVGSIEAVNNLLYFGILIWLQNVKVNPNPHRLRQLLHGYR